MKSLATCREAWDGLQSKAATTRHKEKGDVT
jgi:hypothetical protein